MRGDPLGRRAREHVEYLENGRALTFPYAFVPWMLGRDRWLLLWFTSCPLFLGSILSFEMAYVWALCFAFQYVHALGRGRMWRALLWFVVAAGTHTGYRRRGPRR